MYVQHQLAFSCSEYEEKPHHQEAVAWEIGNQNRKNTVLFADGLPSVLNHQWLYIAITLCYSRFVSARPCACKAVFPGKKN
jgi:hypothetical protein